MKFSWREIREGETSTVGAEPFFGVQAGLLVFIFGKGEMGASKMVPSTASVYVTDNCILEGVYWF